MSEQKKDALLLKARAALHGTHKMLEQILQDDDDITLSASHIGGFMGDDQKVNRKPEIYQQFDPDYIVGLRKEAFSKVAVLSARGEGQVMRFFERINWKGSIDVTEEGRPRRVSPDVEIREALYPPLPESGKRDFSKWKGDRPTLTEQEATRKRRMDENEAEAKMKRIIFLLRDLRAQINEQATVERRAEALKQQRLRNNALLMRLYGQAA